jgi:hypothetical protein
MAEPKADRGDVDESKEAFGGFVVTGGDPSGVLKVVEAALDEVAQAVKGAIHGNTQFAGLSHRDHGQHVARLHGFANLVRVIASVCQQGAGLGEVVVHDQVEAEVIRPLPRRDVRPHGQARAVDAEVDFGREATP